MNVFFKVMENFEQQTMIADSAASCACLIASLGRSCYSIDSSRG